MEAGGLTSKRTGCRYTRRRCEGGIEGEEDGEEDETEGEQN